MTGLYQPGISRRAGRPNRIMRAVYPQVQGHFTCVIIGHCARIVIMGPEPDIIVVLGDIVDFVLRFHIPVLSGPDIDTYPVRIHFFPIYTGTQYGLTAAVDGDA